MQTVKVTDSDGVHFLLDCGITASAIATALFLVSLLSVDAMTVSASDYGAAFFQVFWIAGFCLGLKSVVGYCFDWAVRLFFMEKRIYPYEVTSFLRLNDTPFRPSIQAIKSLMLPVFFFWLGIPASFFHDTSETVILFVCLSTLFIFLATLAFGVFFPVFKKIKRARPTAIRHKNTRRRINDRRMVYHIEITVIFIAWLFSIAPVSLLGWPHAPVDYLLIFSEYCIFLVIIIFACLGFERFVFSEKHDLFDNSRTITAPHQTIFTINHSYSGLKNWSGMSVFFTLACQPLTLVYEIFESFPEANLVHMAFNFVLLLCLMPLARRSIYRNDPSLVGEEEVLNLTLEQLEKKEIQSDHEAEIIPVALPYVS